MITLESNNLIFRFPEVHEHAKTGNTISKRTLRIPDDGKHYPLPPGLGAFPLAMSRTTRTACPGTGASAPA